MKLLISTFLSSSNISSFGDSSSSTLIEVLVAAAASKFLALSPTERRVNKGEEAIQTHHSSAQKVSDVRENVTMWENRIGKPAAIVWGKTHHGNNPQQNLAILSSSYLQWQLEDPWIRTRFKRRIAF